MRFKRLLLLILSTLSIFSCSKEQIDYSQPVAVYRKGDPSFVLDDLSSPIVSLHPGALNSLPFLKGKDVYGMSLVFMHEDQAEITSVGIFFNAEVKYKEGDIVDLEYFVFNHLNPGLGSTRMYQSGKLRYMGTDNGEGVFRFEDIGFTVAREDGSKVVDEYYIRGTVRCMLNKDVKF